MTSKQIFWDVITRVIPVILVYIIKEIRSKNKLKNLKVSNSQYAAKTSFYPQIMQLKNDQLIKDAVQRMFEQTCVTRFLILVGVNKKDPTQHVSVVFSRKKEDDGINPKEIYQNLPTDNHYKAMLHQLKKEKEIIYDVFEMPRGMLKSIYYKEQISHTIIKEVDKTFIDDDNDAYVFSSISTDTEEPIPNFDKIIIDKEFKLIKKLLKAR